MDERQTESGEFAGPVSTGSFLITVHGIGPYDASRGASYKLMGALDSSLVATLKPNPIDFNWCALVEGGHDDRGNVTQLSRSILEAAHLGTDEQTGVAGYLIRGAGFLFEALFKLLLFSVAACALLLMSAVSIYVRFGSFGLGEVGTSFAFHWLGVLWTLMVAFLALVLIASALLRAGRRRVFAATLLRRVILVLLQPLIPLAYRLGETTTRKVIRGLALLAIFFGLFTGGIYWWSPDRAAQWSGLGIKNLAIGAAGLAGAYFVALSLSKLISAPVKLARDIFNYIGDVQQRAVIQQGLSRRVEDQFNGNIPRDAHVIVIGHSLGSVIALDSLCNSNVWAAFASVSLVTGGSPIFRFFQRFFPGLYFPRDAAHCVSRIQSRSQIVRWLNVFRAGLLRGDPVGQALFSRGGSGTDLPLRQRDRILMKAHVDYWEDNKVIELVRGAWRRRLPPEQMLAEQSSANPVRHASLFDRLHDISQKILVICAVGGGAFALTNAFAIVHERREVAEAFLARAVSTGVETRAKVTHSTTYWGYGEDLAFPVQVYEFEFRDQKGELRRLIFREDESDDADSGLYFDSSALRKHLGRDEESRNKTTFDIAVLCLEDDKGHLTLADPGLRPTQRSFPIFGVLYRGIGPIFWLIVFSQVLIYYACRGVANAILPQAHFTSSLADGQPQR